MAEGPPVHVPTGNRPMVGSCLAQPQVDSTEDFQKCSSLKLQVTTAPSISLTAQLQRRLRTSDFPHFEVGHR
jgi:hypothetical protein